MDESVIWEKLHGNSKLHEAKLSAIGTVVSAIFFP